jgi:hypothetical protein
MAEKAGSGDKRKRRAGVVVGKRAVRKQAQTNSNVRATRAGTQRSQNK